MPLDYSLLILAPRRDVVPSFGRRAVDDEAHKALLKSVQSLRGQVYLHDGAICTTDLDKDGGFVMVGDQDAWHLVLLNKVGKAAGCVRFVLHDPAMPFSSLNVAHSAIALNPEWRERVRRAVQSDLDFALKERLTYVEVGGWALHAEYRNTKAAFELLIASYALGALWGGAVGCCTATARNSSSSMLRRLGGASFEHDGEVIPPYYDLRYGCQMELLRFDYRFPAKRFASAVPSLSERLSNSNVVIADDNQVSTSMTRDLLKLDTAICPLLVSQQAASMVSATRPHEVCSRVW